MEGKNGARPPAKGGNRRERMVLDPMREIILVLVVAMLIVVSGLTFLAALPEPDLKSGARLSVDEVYFVARDLDNNKTSLEVFMFITNEGGKPAGVTIRAFAIDVTSNLAHGQDSTDIGNVRGESTSEAEMDIVLTSDRKYRIEVLLFKDGKVSIKGEATVNLQEGGYGGSDYRTTVSDPGGDTPEEPPVYNQTRMVGLSVIALFWIVITYAVVYRRCRR